MKYTIPLILFLLACVGCKQVVKRIETDTWSTLRIISEGETQITIRNWEDPSIVNIYHNGSFFAPLPKNMKVKVDTFKVFFTQAEKDTLFSLVEDLIQHPAKTNRFCTEFVGSLDLIVVYGEQIKQRVKYSSVCDWTILSDKTQRLHDILRTRIKNIYLGERGAAISHVQSKSSR